MANILGGICPEGSILDGLADWSASITLKKWFRLTRELHEKTIADMDLDPAALDVVPRQYRESDPVTGGKSLF